MSLTSSTSFGSGTSVDSSAAATAALPASEFLHACCLVCHSARDSLNFSINFSKYSPGARVVILDDFFLSLIIFCKNFSHSSSDSHSNLISSKPSEAFGSVNEGQLVSSVLAATSGTGFGRNQVDFSVSSNSAMGGSISSSESSFFSSAFFSSSLFSPSSFFSSAFSSFLPSLAFFSSSSCFFFNSSIFACSFCLCFMIFLLFHSRVTLSCFSCNNLACWYSLKSSLGSPIITYATFL
mmetsp:Transcript_28660/g.62371  ORF Transcript_28660/g.62371 Transcript_28660/m.62371 type:complete len:238 (+) Transcript_28660:773-1486(+)